VTRCITRSVLTTAATAEKHAATYSAIVGPCCGAMPKISATSARLTGQTLGAALVALIFGIAPQNGPIIVLYVATCFSAVAAVVSTLRVMQRA
jgi:hypothetical protein